MIMKCTVVIIFVCFFVISRGDIQGDIEQRLSALDQNLKNLGKTVKKISRDVQKLLNDQNVAESISEKMPTVTIAEMIYYQNFPSGLKGLKHYIELEAIRDGKMKKNIIPMLIEINNEQKDVTLNVVLLYETLNTLALNILKNCEETEIEAYFLETKDNIHTFITNINSLKSTDLKMIGKKVLLRMLKKVSDINKIQSAMIYYEDDAEYESELFDVWLETLVNYSISDALDGIRRIKPENYILRAYDKLLTYAKGEDMLKVVDSILNFDHPNPKYNQTIIELRKKIPYNDDDLKKLIQNSTESFTSKKLIALMLRNYLENSPNEPKIINLAVNLVSRYSKAHMDYEYIDKTVQMLPNIVIALAKQEKFCLINDGRYIFANEDIDNIRVTGKNDEKPYGAGWSFRNGYSNGFIILNEEARRSEQIIISKNRKNLKIGYIFDTTGKWQFDFIDLSPRAKIGNGKQFFKIEGRDVILDDTATIWDLVTC